MRTFWLIVFLAAASSLSAAMNLRDAGYAASLSTSVTSAPASSCPTDAVFTNDTVAANRGFGGGLLFGGQRNYTNLPTRSLCKVAFRVFFAGTMTNNPWQACVFPSKGTFDMDVATPLAVSDAVTLTTEGNNTNWIPFTFSTPYAFIANSNVCIVVRPHTNHSGNDYLIFSGGAVLPGYNETFSTVGAGNFGSGASTAMMIWWFTP